MIEPEPAAENGTGSAVPEVDHGGELVVFPNPASAPAKGDAKPRDRAGRPTRPSRDEEIRKISNRFNALSEGIACRDERATFENLVGANELSSYPVHRWYSYKEAFSPRLPLELVERLGVGRSGLVVDSFAGVATSALSLQTSEVAKRVIGVEYSPFAHFVGDAKLRWPDVSASGLRKAAEEAAGYKVDPDAKIPALAAFSNKEIFAPDTLLQLIAARDSIKRAEKMSLAERRLLTLGLASVIEDASGVKKDGRALRILRGRGRQPKALRPKRGAAIGSGVREMLTNQWLAMAEDLEELSPQRASVRKRRDRHLRGDARDLAVVRQPGRKGPVLGDGSAGLFLYSPPYLNCIDYTEVYKLELWMLGFVRDQTQFREVRLGTLRSHPSVRFPKSHRFDGLSSPAIEIVKDTASLLDERLPRPGLGEMTANYFEDMLKVLAEQFRVLEPGGHTVCVVANSTFSRREKTAAGWREAWRLPILTDVLIARLAEVVGFEHVEIWEARDLQPKNVRMGSARESLVVARKG
jgi:hypothetical protein